MTCRMDRTPMRDGSCIHENTIPIYDAACSLVSRRLREARESGDTAAERAAKNALARLEAVFHEYVEGLAGCEASVRCRTIAMPFVRAPAACDTITDTLLFLELAGDGNVR